MPGCRSLGVVVLADELQVIPREGLSQNRECRLHFQGGKPLLRFEYELKP